MAEPTLKREGNLRFAGIAAVGYPADAKRLGEQVRRELDGGELAPYGPVMLLFSLPPDGPPGTWDCQIGTAVIGLPRPVGRVAIEDYRGLYALSLPHAGAIRQLPESHHRLVEHARGLGYHARPYWRLALCRRRLADGNCLPISELSIFLDRR